MAKLSTGQGGGAKRRNRTMLRSYGNTRVVSLLRNNKRLPSNWRELLGQAVNNACGQVPSHYFTAGTSPRQRQIARPYAVIPQGSSPTSPITFVLDSDASTASLQHKVIDSTLRNCDVMWWQVPRFKSEIGKGKECFVQTNLPLTDTLMGITRNIFVAARLRDIPGVNWLHVRQYTVQPHKGKYLGIRTECQEPCECRTALPKVWHLGWEMHY